MLTPLCYAYFSNYQILLKQCNIFNILKYFPALDSLGPEREVRQALPHWDDWAGQMSRGEHQAGLHQGKYYNTMIIILIRIL